MNSSLNRRETRMYGASLIMAPLLQAVSSFCWLNGEYGATGGTLLVLSIVFWIPALLFLFNLVRDRLPGYASRGFLIAVLGFISGANFAMLGVMSEVFNIPLEHYIAALAKYPVTSAILLFQTGPLAPLSLVILGIVLLRTRSFEPIFAILLIACGIAFPLSRISRIEWTAHVADSLLLIPLAGTGIKLLAGNKY